MMSAAELRPRWGPWLLAAALGLACSSAERAQPDAPVAASPDAVPAVVDASPAAADLAVTDGNPPEAVPGIVADVGTPEAAPAVADARSPDAVAVEVVDAAAPDVAAIADAAAPDLAPLADAAAPDLAPLADAAAPDTGPLADPIPGEPAAATIAVVLEELAVMPASRPSPEPSDPRLRRHARINYLGEVPDGSGRLFVPDLNGRLYFVKDGTPRVYLDLGAAFAPDFWSHRGLGSGFGFVAFHPDFGRNGVFYTVHTEARGALTAKVPSLPSQQDPAHHGVVTEWTAADPRADAFSGTRRETLRLGFRTYLHGIQQIDFDPSAGAGERGLLYLAVGDGGAGLASGDPQDLGKPHGKILRIDPAGTGAANGRYGIPPGNPFAGKPGALGEVYGYGLRDPHRFSWDPGPGGRLFLANIGEHNIESIYEVRPGDNFGWPEREGPFLVDEKDPTCSVYPLPANDATLGFTYPVVAYDHDPAPGSPRCLDTGDAVVGGFVYRGTRVPPLTGHYVFGDVVNGRLFHADAAEMRRNGTLATIRALELRDEQGRRVTMPALAGDARVDLRLGRDAAGELYVLSKANGKIWRVKSGTTP